MRITLATEAGFCFGVERAVCTVERLLGEGKKVCTLGPIIHNPHEVERLAGKGVMIISSVKEAPLGYHVVIRSHGVPKEVLVDLKEKAIPYCDTTCPYVTKIQKLAADHSAQGKTLLIAGDANHPEILGIISHSGLRYECFADGEQLTHIIQKNPPNDQKSYIMLAQTTFNCEEWVKCGKIARNTYTNLEIFDTICNATMLRQNAAETLAKDSDLMIVIGGKNSSNTAKLAQICSRFCETVLIESPEELLDMDFSAVQNIGVTAGASTPAFIIKEVQRIMSDKVNNDEMSFEEMLDESFKTINARDRVTGVVTSVSQNEIAVDIGTKHAGYVPLFEYTDDPNANLEELVKVNDEIELVVLRLNDAEGTALLSKKRLDAIAGFEIIQKAEENDEVLKGNVIEVVKGGLIVLCNNVRVFIPASHATIPRGQDLSTLLGQEVDFKLLETNPNRRRAVGSIREVLLVQRKVLADEFWKEAKVGDVRKGVVKSLTSYGAFIDLGGVDGMAHISELSWTRIKHPSDVVSIGDEVEVSIKELDAEERKISLSYKDQENNPWTILERDYEPGNVVMVKIVSMTTFGAFAEVIPGVDGLIHISQISHDRIEKPADVLSVGMQIEAVITDIDFERRRVSLSVRALLDEEERIREEEEGTSPEVVGEFGPDETILVPEEFGEGMEEIDVTVTTSDEVEEIAEEAEEIAETVSEKAEEVVEEAEEVVEEAEEINETVSEKAEEVVEKVSEKAKEVAEEAEEINETVSEKAEEVVEKVSEKAKEVAEKVSKKAKEVAEKVSKKAKEIVEEIKEEIEEIKEEIDDENDDD